MPDLKFIRPGPTAAKCGCSLRTLYRWLESDPTFPKRVHLGPHMVGFFSDEVDAWLNAKRCA